MSANTPFRALRSAASLQGRWSGASATPLRSFHPAVVARKDPPLKGPVPVETKEEPQEGGDGFLGVSWLSQRSMHAYPATRSQPRLVETALTPPLRPCSMDPRRPSRKVWLAIPMIPIRSWSAGVNTSMRRSPTTSSRPGETNTSKLRRSTLRD